MAVKKIMVVDDSATERHVLGELLTKNGFQVVFVEDGETAVAKSKTELPDLILMRRANLRHGIPAALFAGRHCYTAPMRYALVGALPGQPCHAAPGLHRLNFRRAQLGGLLHHPVHFFAAAHGLGQDDAQRGLRVVHAGLQLMQHHAFAIDFTDLAIQRAPVSVEYLHRIVYPQAQYAVGVMRRLAGQFKHAFGRQRRRAIKAWQRHGRDLRWEVNSVII